MTVADQNTVRADFTMVVGAIPAVARRALTPQLERLLDALKLDRESNQHLFHPRPVAWAPPELGLGSTSSLAGRLAFEILEQDRNNDQQYELSGGMASVDELSVLLGLKPKTIQLYACRQDRNTQPIPGLRRRLIRFRSAKTGVKAGPPLAEQVQAMRAEQKKNPVKFL